MITLGRLNQSARFFHTDTFTVWNDATEQFEAGFTGRLYPFDRFKTIYHRPTRRETLGVSDASFIPSSHVIKHTASNETFIVGATLREDSDHDKIYDTAFSLHRPSLLADLVRPTVQGTGDDLGPLVDVTIGKMHLDTELRTSSPENEAYEKYKGQFFITMPNSYVVESGDFLVTSEQTYRVQVVYQDGGYQMARADNMDDKRTVLTYKLPTSSGSSYDPATGVYVGITTVDRLFSALVTPVVRKEDTDTTDIQDKTLRVVVDFDHIGFTPEPEHTIVMGSETLFVSQVRSDIESRQWLLTCRRG